MIEASGDQKRPVDVTPKRSSVAHAWLTAAFYAELQAEAARRRLHPDAFAAAELEAAALDGFAIVDR